MCGSMVRVAFNQQSQPSRASMGKMTGVQLNIVHQWKNHTGKVFVHCSWKLKTRNEHLVEVEMRETTHFCNHGNLIFAA